MLVDSHTKDIIGRQVINLRRQPFFDSAEDGFPEEVDLKNKGSIVGRLYVRIVPSSGGVTDLPLPSGEGVHVGCDRPPLGVGEGGHRGCDRPPLRVGEGGHWGTTQSSSGGVTVDYAHTCAVRIVPAGFFREIPPGSCNSISRHAGKGRLD